MANKKIITFLCGVTSVETWNFKGRKYIEISLYDLYNGSGELNNPLKLSQLFLELSTEGYSLEGLSYLNGPYDSIDDIFLRASKIE